MQEELEQLERKKQLEQVDLMQGLNGRGLVEGLLRRMGRSRLISVNDQVELSK